MKRIGAFLMLGLLSACSNPPKDNKAGPEPSMWGEATWNQARWGE